MLIQGSMTDALIVGEVPLKVTEVQKFIYALLEQGMLFSALHNHELSEEQRVYYIHFSLSGLPAAELASKVHHVLKTIKIEKE